MRYGKIDVDGVGCKGIFLAWNRTCIGWIVR